ncbi:hypothetical protein BCR32DRAFT_265971 [Anaeromyces robustus]|jgi:lipopolysaccharide/colanic/teichoic acid biosynthesis glycosyltransferase|uniref:Uncharacterized protein n=1 Tax=Anaeromyces robustus TaxID=1754192 RepID=A0A1Y1XGV9_9FUNG|nr:hypothetical protein BCR32DRAFT_265971 [Anaeromyces robustus]|eukprot:ORX84932.1 hypothetical protein BCR32DRAFT_265971 [Anaeromyces robustus]
MPSNEEKRSGCFPRLNSYWCCCCIPLRPGVKLSTWMIIISIIVSMIYNMIKNGFDFGLVVIYIIYFIVLISLILLLIGIHKVNLPFMKQFKVVFFLFLVFQVVLMIIDLHRRFSDKKFYTTINGKQYEHIEPNTLGWFKKLLLICLAIINFLILLYYYVATCSYIEEVEDDVKDYVNNRRLESRK